MQALRFGLAVGIVALLAGCGGPDELAGEPEVPDGYATYRGEGVSFAHPEGFEPDAETLPNGVTQVMLRDPARDDGAYVHLTVAPERGDDIEPLMRSMRVAVESIYDGSVGEAREVDVPGATAARRVDARQPAKGGPVFESDELLVLGGDERFYALSAAVPESEPDALDRDAVVRSFRLEAGG